MSDTTKPESDLDLWREIYDMGPAYVVRASRCHQALIDALEAAKPMLEAQLKHIQDNLSGEYRMPALEQVVAALSKARETA